MKNKKILISIIIASVMLSLVLPVFAAEITAAGAQNVTVKHNVGEGYIVTIPADFTFEVNGTDYTSTQVVKATDVLIEAGKTLNVKMSSANYKDADGYTLQDSSKESKIVYTIETNAQQAFTNEGTVLSVAAGTDEGSANLTFSTTEEEIAKATKSGDHTDILTFTVSVD